MINIIVVTHGEFGAYLVEAAESIVGRQERGVRAISISSRVSAVEIKERLKAAINELASPEGLAVFTDMPGGTPANLSFPLIKDRRGVELIGGVNLYMLVSAFTHREEPVLEKFVEKVVFDGKKSVCDIRQMFLARTR